MPGFSDNDFWQELKKLSAGGDVTDSLKGKQLYTFTNKAKFLLTANDLPKGAPHGKAIDRRLLIVPFKASFDKDTGEDKFIEDRIIDAELPGVLNMALEAYHRFRANNYEYTSSKAVDKALEDFKLETDNVARWCHEHIIREEDAIGATQQGTKPDWMVVDSDGRLCANVSAMFVEYKNWVEAEGEKPLSRPHFSKRLLFWYTKGKAKEVSLVRRRIGGERPYLLYGVTWRCDADL